MGADVRHEREKDVLRLAVWQVHPTPRDPDANLVRLRAAAEQARSEGAALLVTPELTLTGYDVGELDGLTRDDDVDRVAAVARDVGIALVVGLALAEPPDHGPHHGPHHVNASVVVDRDGTVRATHRKAHLFGDLDRNRFTPGTEPFAMTELDGIWVATMICYDVEFAEGVRAAALVGAQLLAVPTANMRPFEIVCEQVVPVRAWENQIAIAYANHCGREGETHYVGRSVVVGPDGRPLAVAGPDDEQLVVADVDLGAVADAQRANPYLTDRRPELYEDLVMPRPPRRSTPSDTDME